MRIPVHGRGQLKVGGVNPGSGRPKDEFKAFMRSLLSREEADAAIEAIIRDKDHPHHMKARQYATEHGYGKAVETLEVSGKDGGPISMTVNFRK